MKIPMNDERKAIILELCSKLGVKRENYDDLPEQMKEFYSHFSYEDLCFPLVKAQADQNMKRRGRHYYNEIARRYKLTKRKVQYMVCCRKSYQI